jgi:hypothetical protein
LLFTGSQDQLVCSWQPLHEANRAPAGLLLEVPAAAEQQQGAAAARVGERGLEQAPQQAAVRVAAAETELQGAADDQQLGNAAATKLAAKRQAGQQFVLPRARSFLPELPDTSHSAGMRLQALLDLVALAEALYPPAQPAGAGAGGEAALDEGVLGMLLDGCGVPDGAAGAAAAAEGGGGGGSGSSSGSVAGAYQQQHAALIGPGYTPGSWLPTMTADVPELLLQHQAAQGAHTRAPAAAAAASSVCAAEPAAALLPVLTRSQLGMLQFIAGDVRGFLQTAAAAGSISPDVVALASAGGAPAWRAAARLASAKPAAAGDRAGAALHAAAAGDSAALAG